MGWFQMKIFPLFCSCLILSGCGLGSSSDPWEQIELGTDAEFRDMFFLDNQNGWMVGAGGINVGGGILGRTRDGGLTWEYQTGLIAKKRLSNSVDLNAVHFLDLQRGIIAAESGVILLTEDGGDSWETVSFAAPIYAHLYDIDFIDDLKGWIVGSKGVLVTEDGGQTWAPAEEEDRMGGRALDFIDHSRGWVVGKLGAVHRTEDGGSTWSPVFPMGNLDGLTGDERPSFSAVHFVDENHGWIAGYWQEFTLMEQHRWAVILHTTDGGQTWTKQAEGIESLLTDIRFANPLHGWAVGFNRNNGTSAILNTEDGGQTWLLAKEVFGEELLALSVQGGQVWAAGDRSRDEPQRLLRFVTLESSQ